MKDFNQPQSKETAIALGFTLGVHVVAIVGLLFLGMSKPLEPPKQIKTVLVKPEDIPPLEAEPLEISDSVETADTHIAENIQQTAEPVVDAPNIPITPPPLPTPTPKVDMQKAAAEAKAAEAEQKAAADAAKAQAKAVETARLKAAEAEKARQEANEKIRQAKN